MANFGAQSLLPPPPLLICASNFRVRHLAIRTKLGVTPKYLTYSTGCSGAVSFQLPSGPGGSPGNNQLFVGHLTGANIFVYQPKLCSSKYLRQWLPSGVVYLSSLCTKFLTTTTAGNSIITTYNSIPTRYWLTGSTLVTSQFALSPYIV